MADDKSTRKSSTSGPSSTSEPTKDELYQKASTLDVEGRSSMDKEELKEAVEDAKAAPHQNVSRTREG